MARKESIYRRGSRWGFMVREDNTIIGSGVADSKAEATKRAKAVRKGRKKAKRKTKKRTKKRAKKATRKRAAPKRKAPKRKAKKATRKAPRKRRAIKWRTVTKPGPNGYKREYRWHEVPGGVVVQNKRQGKWEPTHTANVLEYFRGLKDGRGPKWPYTLSLRTAPKPKAKRKRKKAARKTRGKSGGGNPLRRALRKDV